MKQDAQERIAHKIAEAFSDETTRLVLAVREGSKFSVEDIIEVSFLSTNVLEMFDVMCKLLEVARNGSEEEVEAANLPDVEEFLKSFKGTVQ